MPRKAKELSSLAVSRLSTTGLHSVGGVAGLALQIKGPGVRSWILRAVIGDKRRWIGLGAFPDVSLSDAREAARKCHGLIAQGIDPIDAENERRHALMAQQQAELVARERAKTFAQCAEAYIAMMEPSWKNAKHSAQWTNTLVKYAYPFIGDLLVKDITRDHVLSVLEPIWLIKTETAKRVRNRIENILDWAEVKGYRAGDNPARWHGRLQRLLPPPSKVQKVVHQPSLPVKHIAEFMAELRQERGTAARALEFLILTGARTGEVTGAVWAEVQWDEAIWRVPKERMKMSNDHRKLLCTEAVALLKDRYTRGDPVELIFPSSRKGTEQSDMTLSAVIKRIQQKRITKGLPPWTDPAIGRRITTHGFRATFKTWVAEETNYPREMAEMALAHVVGAKTEMAYWRGDMLEKRRHLMQDWAAVCAGANVESEMPSK
jgi:integrase